MRDVLCRAPYPMYEAFMIKRILIALISAWIVSSFSAGGIELSFRFERLWPTLVQPWYFNSPSGLVCDNAGNVYIADSFNRRIQKFTSQGQFITLFNGRIDGGSEFDMPIDIALDTDGNLYVLDNVACKVRIFSPLGKEIGSWGGKGVAPGLFNSPRGIALDTRDIVYVADTGNSRIQLFQKDGTYIGILGEKEGLSIELAEPHSLAFDEQGTIYIADSANNRIVVVRNQPNYVEWWTAFGTEAFNYPIRVLADKKGHIYIADTGNFRICKFSVNGQPVLSWGQEGHGTGEFATLDGLAINNFGQILAADRGWHDRIQVFTPEGVFITAWGSQRGGLNEFNGPTDMASDAEHAIYVTDFGNSRIQKLSAAGQFIDYWGPQIEEPGHCRQPYSFTIDGLYQVAYAYDLYDGFIRQYELDGTFVKEWDSQANTPDAFHWAAGLCAAAGRLYMADAANHRIRVFNSEGMLLDNWGEIGTNEGQFLFPYDVTTDPQGLVYVADTYNNRIQVFGEGGTFLRSWGSEGSEYGQFNLPVALLCTEDGFVFVSDGENHRIQLFSTGGDFITSFGVLGGAPGQFNGPAGLLNLGNTILIADTLNNRIQQFRRLETASRAHAIIVAGGGPMAGNSLWDATRLCAHYAYHVLRHIGYAKEDISLLSADTQVDLDNDGIANDVTGNCTLDNLDVALKTSSRGSDLLLLYMVDHGGPNTFRMNEKEVLQSSQLLDWLNELRPNVAGPMIVINDSCQSGSLVEIMATAWLNPSPIVITSAKSGQSAYFLGTGASSFSSFFWTEILHGQSLKSAFSSAAGITEDLYELQSPQLDSNGDGIANLSADYESISNVYLGTGHSESSLRPVLETVVVPEEISGSEPLHLAVYSIRSRAEIAHVWAIVRPPNANMIQSGIPISWLPTIALNPTTRGGYAGIYHDFPSPGTYQVTLYARDTAGQTSLPVVRSVAVDNPLRDRAVIVAAARPGSPLWATTAANGLAAYNALRFQQIGDDDISFFCSDTISAGVDGLPTLSNVQYALTQLPMRGIRNLILYITGEGYKETVRLSAQEYLVAQDLASWLTPIDDLIAGKLIVVCDFCEAGSFLPWLAKPEPSRRRSIISSCGTEGTLTFTPTGDVSFSLFFWRQILAGASIRAAFLHASSMIRFSHPAFAPLLDDTGDGIYNSSQDGFVSASLYVGMGLQFASDPPIIDSVTNPQVVGKNNTSDSTLTKTMRNLQPGRGTKSTKDEDPETTVMLWADGITSTAGVAEVFAVLTPPTFNPWNCLGTGVSQVVLPMSQTGAGQYRTSWNGLDQRGTYQVTIYARDNLGQLSPGRTTYIRQLSGTVLPDSYEPDDAPGLASWIGINEPPQHHNFSHENDEDWSVFFAEQNQVIVIETRHLCPAADTRIELYSGNNPLVLEAFDDNSNPAEVRASLILWRTNQEGSYFVRTTNLAPEVFGADTCYTLEVSDETGLSMPGAIAVFVKNVEGQPVSEAKVSLVEFGSLIFYTDSHGEALFPTLPPRNYTVAVDKEGFLSAYQSTQVNSGQTTNVIFTLKKAPTTEGEVEGEPWINPESEDETLQEGEGEDPVLVEGEGEASSEGEVGKEGEDSTPSEGEIKEGEINEGEDDGGGEQDEEGEGEDDDPNSPKCSCSPTNKNGDSIRNIAAQFLLIVFSLMILARFNRPFRKD